jgi:DNA polymerase III subunit alpha
MPSLALTDNGNLFGALEFTKKALKNNIHPILGSNIVIGYGEDPVLENNFFQITCLIINEKGWKNLSHIVSKIYLNNKIDNIKFIKINEFCNFNEGLIVLFNDASDNNFISSSSPEFFFIKTLLNSFGDRLYLDLYREHSGHASFNEANLLMLSEKYDLPLAVTNNISFLTKKMIEAHDCLMCIHQSTTIADTSRTKVNPEAFFKNSDEMCNIFHDKKEALENTINIAKRCNFILQESKPKLPNININNNLSEESIIYNSALKGLKKKINYSPEKLTHNNLKYKIYFDRLEYELKVICEMGYAGYFLIVSDFIKWSKKNNIPVGPGRGSGAGSIVAWSLSITDLDPIKYGLLFERFLNPDRVSLPDFDIDFCKHRREEVIEYVKNKYGEDKVAQIITFGSLQARAVIRDIGRVLGINYGRVDKIAKLIPNNPGAEKSLIDIVKKDLSLKSLIEEDEDLKKLFDISIKLEGLNRNASTHAAGLVISNSPIVLDVPLYYDAKSYLPATQFSMKYLEDIGLIKFDFLGLETLSVLDSTVKLLSNRGININIDNIDLNQKKTYNTLSSGNTLGVFQLESVPMRQVLKQLKPDRIEDIIAVVALYRPGPMEQIPAYIARKHDNSLTSYPHPLLEDLLKETHGIMIYQEQVMEAARIIAGFSLAKADLLRRAMGKKIKSEMDDLKESFITGSAEKKISSSKSKKIFNDIEKFAGYGFNKSHAAAYAIISYQTAWCKTNYPEEFFTSLLNSEINNANEKYSSIKSEIEKLGIKILKPDLNYSEPYFSVQNNNNKLVIRSGLANIKNISYELAKFIVNERVVNGNFTSVIDFFSRLNPSIINKRQVEYLTMAGVFDDFEYNRATIYNSASNLLMISQNLHKEEKSNQQIMFHDQNKEENFNHLINKEKPWSKEEYFLNEFYSLGFLVSGHPLQEDSQYFNKFNLSNSSIIEENNISGKTFEVLVFLMKFEEKNQGNIKFLDLSFIDLKGVFNLRVYRDKIDELSVKVKVGTSYIITLVHAIDRDNRMRLRLKSMIESDNLKKSYFNSFNIYIDNIKCLEKLKYELDLLDKGNKNINFFYKDIEFSSGIRVKYDVDLENTIKNIEGINNIKKIM